MNATVQKGVAWFGYPVMISWPVVVSLAALRSFPLSTDPIRAQVQQVLLFLVVAVPIVSILIFLERKMAAQPEQKVSAVDLRTDLTHLAMCWFVVNPLAQGVVRLMVFAAAGTIAALAGTHLWPSGWPVLAQLLLAVAIGEFGTYWFHRLAHETGLGWRIHATHHATPQVYWLNSTRFHALELIIKSVFQVGPLILLGCTREAFLVYGVFTMIHGWVQHSNVAYRTGWLDYLMATPRNHRWHHSTVISESNTNYGLMIALWDHLFRSFFSPRDRAYPAAIGVSDLPNFPLTYFRQFLTPFAWERLLASQPRPQPGQVMRDAPG